jgi:16S rRNA processing protein RimM
VSAERTRLVVGLVRGLHGLDGTVRIEVLTDTPEVRLAVGATLFPEGQARGLTLERAAPVADGPGWWLTFHEIRSRSAAERLREVYLEVEVDRGADLEPGQAYWHEIVGSEVRDSGGRPLGHVTDIYRAGETEVYVVRGDAVGEFDVPAVRGIITEFAPERREIVVDEVALDLGAAAAAHGTPRKRPRKPHRWSRHGKGGSSAEAPSEAIRDASSEAPTAAPKLPGSRREPSP